MDKFTEDGQIREILESLERDEEDCIDQDVEQQIDSDDDGNEDGVEDITNGKCPIDVEESLIMNVYDAGSSSTSGNCLSDLASSCPVPFGDDDSTPKERKRKSGSRSSVKTPKAKKEKKSENNTTEPNEITRSSSTILDVGVLDFISKNGDFKWQSTPFPQNSAKSLARNIVYKRSGPKGVARSARSPKGCFKLFFSDEMMQKILDHTNEEIESRRAEYKVQSNPTLKNISIEELHALVGLLFLSAAMKNNHLPLYMLFRPEYCGENYLACFSKERFKFLLVCLRFDDKSTRTERAEISRLAPISELWDSFIVNCRTQYEPSMYLTIDEQLVGFRGRVPFMMYIPSKPDKYGMKIIMMCDSSSYFMIDAIAYTGKGCSPSDVPAAEYYVTQLVDSVKGSNRNITMDNWFTSIPLAKKLLQDKLTMIGTIRKDKKELPPEFTDPKFRNRNSGTSFFLFDKDITAVSYKPQKNKLVTLISTMHVDAAIREGIEKPEIVLNYNQTKRGVDALDRMCHNQDCKRKTNRWPLTFFYNMLNLASANAYIIYLHNSAENGEKPLSRMDFTLCLHRELTADLLLLRKNTSGMPRHTLGTIDRVIRLSVKEPPFEQQPQQEDKSEPPVNNTKKRSACQLCHWSKKRMTTSFCCDKTCAKPVCNEHSAKICVECKAKNY